jgi:hypothetical protein
MTFQCLTLTLRMHFTNLNLKKERGRHIPPTLEGQNGVNETTLSRSSLVERKGLHNFVEENIWNRSLITPGTVSFYPFRQAFLNMQTSETKIPSLSYISIFRSFKQHQ